VAASALVLAAVAADIYTGYALFGERRRWCPNLGGPRELERQHRRGAARVLNSAVSLGGTLIKASQFASVRPDLVPATYAQALAGLQDRVPPQPWSTIETVIRRELRRSIQEVFAAIEPEPVAGAITADLATLESIAYALQKLEPSVRLWPILEHLRANELNGVDCTDDVVAARTP